MEMIREIAPEDTFAVRWPVLRPGKPFESCRFDGDDLPTTKHFGLFDGDVLAGVASVFRENNSNFTETTQLQLRGMAVLEIYRGKHFGKALVQHAEQYARSENAPIMWFNARIIALPFYEKCGYAIIGDAFNIGDIGKHYVMFKRL